MKKINRKSSITLAIITSLFACAVNVDSNTPQNIPKLIQIETLIIARCQQRSATGLFN